MLEHSHNRTGSEVARLVGVSKRVLSSVDKEWCTAGDHEIQWRNYAGEKSTQKTRQKKGGRGGE